MDREEVQSRRAYNQIWNGAGRYDIRPEQAAFDTEGDADLYMNTVMGLAYEQYDFARFQRGSHGIGKMLHARRRVQKRFAFVGHLGVFSVQNHIFQQQRTHKNSSISGSSGATAPCLRTASRIFSSNSGDG